MTGDEARSSDCLSARHETWSAGLADGVVAVLIGTLVGAVAVAVTAPVRRAGATIGVLVVDGLVVLLVAGALAGARPAWARPAAGPPDQVIEAS